MAEKSKNSGGAYVHLISGSYSVTVNNGSGLTLGGSSIVSGRVIVTPLTSTPSPAPVNTPACPPQLISKVLVKAFTKGSKKDSKQWRIYTRAYQGMCPGKVYMCPGESAGKVSLL